jgi:hypothetical protein
LVPAHMTPVEAALRGERHLWRGEKLPL